MQGILNIKANSDEKREPLKRHLHYSGSQWDHYGLKQKEDFSVSCEQKQEQVKANWNCHQG